MPRFFQDFPGGDTARITGQDAVHIRRALRMKPGENLTLCNGKGTDYFCEITGFEGEDVRLKVLYHTPTACEPSVEVTLYQGLPKGEKMEWILQKADGKEEKKRVRWQKIADEAAGQSGRGILPPVEPPLPWKQAVERMRAAAVPVIAFYEGGGSPLSALVGREIRRLAVVVGPEGGFEPSEIVQLREIGARVATLGPRILRCETAPLAALSVIMAMTGNME
mgnify:CR=1 FL=1